MNQRAAFLETIQLAEARGMPADDIRLDHSLTLEHLRDMLTRVTADFSEAKLGRWLGWAQCALVAANVGVSLDDVKAINMRFAEADNA